MKYNNPVIPGFNPDPSVCRVGEDYYLVTSSFEYFPGIPLYHSRDLVNWRQVGYCLTRKSQLDLTNIPAGDGIWAPTIRYHNGRFYLTCTVMGGIGNFLVYTDDIYGEWSDPVLIDFTGIDPSLFFDDDGCVYYTGTGYTDNKYGIHIFRLDVETGKIKTEPKMIWSGTGAYPEAPHIYKINGLYYLLIAEGGTDYGHMSSIARSASVFGPYEPCADNPIISNRSLDLPVACTGHADIIQAHNGSWWAVCLATRPVGYPSYHPLGRETFLASVTWTEDGWPVVNQNGTINTVMEADCLPEHIWPQPGARDSFDRPELGLCWNFLRNPVPDSWSLVDRKGFLALNGLSSNLDGIDPVAFIGRRQQHFAVSVRTLLEFNPAEGEEAGLTALISNSLHYELAVTMSGGVRQVIFRRRIGTLQKVENSIICDHNPIILGIDADWDMYKFFIEAHGEKTYIGQGEARYLSSEAGAAFTGVFFGIYATG
ncbi:MAG TPA: glycoside hydrolase family 43 protein, partial [Clostridia bacterium]|nr:glycoside hydrolase family 43 protein [Clostridia bacterium]